MSLFKVENDILQSMRMHFRLDEYDTSVRLHGGGFPGGAAVWKCGWNERNDV